MATDGGWRATNSSWSVTRGIRGVTDRGCRVTGGDVKVTTAVCRGSPQCNPKNACGCPGGSPCCILLSRNLVMKGGDAQPRVRHPPYIISPDHQKNGRHRYGHYMPPTDPPSLPQGSSSGVAGSTGAGWVAGWVHPPCDIPSGCCSFTGPWTVTRSSLRTLRRVAAF